ncbi:MAG: hypothetical protein NUV75_12985 [Gallionella sp.]|nr:hypothetical protein [Gallionella sp.]
MNILNPAFKYTPAASTDIRKTINKERKRLAELKAAQEAKAKATTVEQEIKVRVLRS